MEEYASEAQQIEQLRQWTRENGPWILAGVAVAVIGYTGYGQWQHWQESKAQRAGETYNQVLATLSKGDRAGAAKLADALRADYGRTPYADQADLSVARAAVEADQLADADKRLTIVIDHSRDDALRLLARYRLARVQRAEGQAEAAQKTLASEPALGFAAAFAELRGDLAVDRGDKDAALKEYRAAEAAGGDGLVNSEVLSLKIASVGGTPASDSAGPAAPGTAVQP